MARGQWDEDKNRLDKWFLTLSQNDNSKLQEGESIPKISLFENLLGVKVDNKFTFKSHVKSTSKKLHSKLNAVFEYFWVLGLVNLLQ